MDETYWQSVGQVIDKHDPWCQGIIVLGLGGSNEAISESFRVAASQPRVKGFAVGRTLFAQAARDWFAGTLDDVGAVATMRANYRSMIDAWDNACAQSRPENKSETPSRNRME
jgi:5-dehydro-2-deoxygluconokinase